MYGCTYVGSTFLTVRKKSITNEKKQRGKDWKKEENTELSQYYTSICSILYIKDYKSTI